MGVKPHHALRAQELEVAVTYKELTTLQKMRQLVNRITRGVWRRWHPLVVSQWAKCCVPPPVLLCARSWHSPLVRFVQDSAMETMTNTNRKITLPYRLQPLELTSMQADYPEYTLINKSNNAHPHAVAGNLRILSMEVLLDSINYRKNSAPLYDGNCFVVDVGGDYLSHVKMGRLNVHTHSDTPVLTPRDSARETSRHLALADMVR